MSIFCEQVGGIVGNILTGVFAEKRIALLDGQKIDGGWLDGNWIQVPYQIADSAAGLGWSFVVTYLLLFLMNKVPGLSLRAEISVERAGLDQGELGLACYEYLQEAVRRSSASIDTSNEKSAQNPTTGNGSLGSEENIHMEIRL